MLKIEKTSQGFVSGDNWLPSGLIHEYRSQLKLILIAVDQIDRSQQDHADTHLE